MTYCEYARRSHLQVFLKVYHQFRDGGDTYPVHLQNRRSKFQTSSTAMAVEEYESRPRTEDHPNTFPGVICATVRAGASYGLIFDFHLSLQ